MSGLRAARRKVTRGHTALRRATPLSCLYHTCVHAASRAGGETGGRRSCASATYVPAWIKVRQDLLSSRLAKYKYKPRPPGSEHPHVEALKYLLVCRHTMSVSHATVPRRVPCILGSTNHAAQFTWHDTDLTMNDIRSVEAAKTRFLIA